MNNGFEVQDYMINSKKYDGKTRKFGITVDKSNYIVKFKKDTISSLYSEYVASKFIQSLGINCHSVWLGTYNGELVVIIKDFTNNNCMLHSYKSTEQSSEITDITTKNYTYNDVVYMINKHTKMSEYNKQKSIQQFWDMFICDAILGNRDRHPGNWGYLTCKNDYIPAPIYDNGASLFPDLELKIDEYIECLNSSKEFKFIANRSERFPASLLMMRRENGELKRTNYYEILSDLRLNKTLAKEIKELRNKVGFNQIYENIIRIMIQTADIIPKPYRRFYVVIVCTRYLHMIERMTIQNSYKTVIGRLNNECRQW